MNQARVRSGMMLAAVPPSWMIPWTRASGPELLAPEPDGREQHDHRVERVLALPRIGRRVRLQAVEDDVDVLRRERLGLDVAAIARVVEQRGVDPGEQAVLDHRRPCRSPAPPPGSPEEHDLAGQLVRDRGERDRGADAGRGHRVVAAAVAEPGKRVVLGEDPDPRSRPAPTAPPRRPDRGLEPARRVLDLEPVAAEDVRDPAGRLAFLERRLGVGVDGVREPDDLVARRLDGGGQPSLDVGVGLRRADHSWLLVKDDLQGSALDRQGRLGDRDEREDEQGDLGLEDPVEAEDRRRAR